MGYLLFGFGWAYALGQLPSGGLLDRFGSKRVYGIAIILWSVFAFLTGFAGYVAASAAFTVIFVLRICSGLAQSPVFPGNGRIVAAWFPTSERGRASAIFNSSQYFALPIFAPIFGGLLHTYGWQSCFWFMGALGAVLTIVWFTNIYGVKDHPRISAAEIETIERGGGLVNTDGKASAKKNTLTWATVKMLLSHRMLGGHLHRPVLHHDAHVVFSHVVSALPVAGAAHVGAEGGICGSGAGALRRLRRNPRRHHLRQAAAARLLEKFD